MRNQDESYSLQGLSLISSNVKGKGNSSTTSLLNNSKYSGVGIDCIVLLIDPNNGRREPELSGA